MCNLAQPSYALKTFMFLRVHRFQMTFARYTNHSGRAG
jgi:hypothetical protein